MEGELTIRDWSELALVEDLLSDFLFSHGKRCSQYDTARKLQKRVLTALQKSTDKLE